MHSPGREKIKFLSSKINSYLRKQLWHSEDWIKLFCITVLMMKELRKKMLRWVFCKPFMMLRRWGTVELILKPSLPILLAWNQENGITRSTTDTFQSNNPMEPFLRKSSNFSTEWLFTTGRENIINIKYWFQWNSVSHHLPSLWRYHSAILIPFLILHLFCWCYSKA